MRDSFIIMPSEQVQELCERTLNYLARKRTRLQNALIQAEKNRAQPWRFFRKRPPLTDEEAKKIVEGHVDYRLAAFYGWHNEEIARKLLKAAAHAKEVHVAASDLYRLRD